MLLEFTEQEPPAQRKYYFDGGSVEIAAQVVYELDAEGKQLRVVELHRLRARQGEGPVPLARGARADWRERKQRRGDLDALDERGIDLQRLGEVAGVPDADPARPAVPSRL